MLVYLEAYLFLVLRFSYYTMTFLMVLSIITIYAEDTSLYFKCDQDSDLRQQLEFVSERESDLHCGLK